MRRCEVVFPKQSGIPNHPGVDRKLQCGDNGSLPWQPEIHHEMLKHEEEMDRGQGKEEKSSSETSHASPVRLSEEDRPQHLLIPPQMGRAGRVETRGCGGPQRPSEQDRSPPRTEMSLSGLLGPAETAESARFGLLTPPSDMNLEIPGVGDAVGHDQPPAAAGSVQEMRTDNVGTELPDHPPGPSERLGVADSQVPQPQDVPDPTVERMKGCPASCAHRATSLWTMRKRSTEPESCRIRLPSAWVEMVADPFSISLLGWICSRITRNTPLFSWFPCRNTSLIGIQEHEMILWAMKM